MLFKLKSVLYPPDATAIKRRRKISRFFLAATCENGVSQTLYGSCTLQVMSSWCASIFLQEMIFFDVLCMSVWKEFFYLQCFFFVKTMSPVGHRI